MPFQQQCGQERSKRKCRPGLLEVIAEPQCGLVSKLRDQVRVGEVWQFPQAVCTNTLHFLHCLFCSFYISYNEDCKDMSYMVVLHYIGAFLISAGRALELLETCYQEIKSMGQLVPIGGQTVQNLNKKKC